MRTALYYQGDGQAARPVPAEEISERLRDKAGLLWLDIAQPADSDFEMLASEFGFHPLAIEDLKQRDQRPKVVDYGEYVFVVAHEWRPAAPPEDLGRRCVERSAEIHAFVGHNYVVTLHTGDSTAMKAARRRWDANGEMQRQGPFYLLYLLLDSLVDDYFPALDAYDERIDALERLVLRPVGREVHVLGRDEQDREAQRPLEAVLELRRNLLEMRRYVAPLRDAVNVLLRRAEAKQDDPAIGDRARTLFTYFQDIYDHTIRVVDTIDTYRDLLAGTLDAHLAAASNRLNEIVKVLTSVSIILMSWAGITGVYGMNFAWMPELHWRYGYAYALGLMVVIGIAEWIYFRRRRWL